MSQRKLKVPIAWSILRERLGTCQQCGSQAHFKDWKQGYPFHYVSCPSCHAELDVEGAVRDYFKEVRDPYMGSDC